jgi:predicted mannosyl-3-phosphoglycerate phosphatase (HAD superfamily)
MKKPVFFTDLDGTLLDFHTYSFNPALPALEHLKAHEVPLIYVQVRQGQKLSFTETNLIITILRTYAVIITRTYATSFITHLYYYIIS